MRHFIHPTSWKHHLAILLSWEFESHDETRETEGFTHLAEHLLFFGTSNYTEAESQDIIYRLFDDWEARTSQTHMKIYCLFHRDDIQEVCDFLYNSLHYAHLTPKDFPQVESEIQSEIQEYKETYEYQDLQDIYTHIPYAPSPLGCDNLTLTYDACLASQDFLREKLHKAHLSVFMLGNWTEKEIDCLSAITHQYPEAPLPEKPPTQETKSYWLVQQPHLYIHVLDTYDTVKDDIFFTWSHSKSDQHNTNCYLLKRNSLRYWIIIGDNVEYISDISAFEKERFFWESIYKKDLASDIDAIKWKNTLDRMRYYHEVTIDASVDLDAVYRSL